LAGPSDDEVTHGFVDDDFVAMVRFEVFPPAGQEPDSNGDEGPPTPAWAFRHAEVAAFHRWIQAAVVARAPSLRPLASGAGGLVQAFAGTSLTASGRLASLANRLARRLAVLEQAERDPTARERFMTVLTVGFAPPAAEGGERQEHAPVERAADGLTGGVSPTGPPDWFTPARRRLVETVARRLGDAQRSPLRGWAFVAFDPGASPITGQLGLRFRRGERDLLMFVNVHAAGPSGPERVTVRPDTTARAWDDPAPAAFVAVGNLLNHYLKRAGLVKTDG